MGLEDLRADVQSAYSELDEIEVAVDRETRTELAMLDAALDPDDPETLVQRAVHLLFQQTVETGKLDFHLRATYDITYDEYLSGMTYDEMTGGTAADPDDERRYQF
jgi:FKBP-type peptidyl-prolyl cis-trans isomerase (trigger factor)